ncbi:serine carboxypeptidase CPVL [Biomphalaria glabrata]|uniref:Probable serine carboxypeptidase CPVL n=1 Tax=Biomphalaria glabrata TaxID=6526 RepID=A0A9U8EBT1_BIOGL|nr:probable serine carboxypeptidase CPVL [Biomphalaria glabrata]XP_013081621.2 probable serine carboxypeptidase CPVL [Biomphalaria glabrata]XP_055883765.1 probable serine carboxypeptidase CPVL [Biomphalaria glabrata]KAI8739709.1 putative serine carboxypeptidase CPVL [Biomphalaria glabrata]
MSLRIKSLYLLVILWSFHCSEAVVSQPLFLTPYLDKGRIREAQSDSLVNSSLFGTDFPNVSHSGYITVNKTLGNHLFFWFFPCLLNTSAPILVWLNGGPGLSSMVGLFYENGPIEICKEEEDCEYKSRIHSWTKWFSMLYIDNPVNVGYSFSESGPAGERLTQDSVSKDLYSFMEQFYSLFPDYKKRELYIGGQSYAGKYVPYLAHVIHTQRQANLSDIPLIGIYIGGPFFDPPTQSPVYFNYLYSMGAISYQQMLLYQKEVQELIAVSVSEPSKLISLNAFIRNLIPETGIPSNDNYVTGRIINRQKLSKIMSSESVRAALHVHVHNARIVNLELNDRFGPDILVSAKSQLATLMDHYKVLVYSGDQDVIVSAQMVETALLSTPWSLQWEYNQASKFIWGAGGSSDKMELRGFFSLTGRFCRVTVKGAGHMTAEDKPEATLDMMKQFVQNGCISTQFISNKTYNLWDTLEYCKEDEFF